MDALVSGGMADQDVCIAVGEDLTQVYPGYMWKVGCNHDAGTVVIDVGVPKPIGMENYGYMLHLSSVLGPGGQKRVRQAGGEMLERLGLRRGVAQADTHYRAVEHGLDLGGAVTKSKGSTI